jgi:hypothetical protein
MIAYTKGASILAIVAAVLLGFAPAAQAVTVMDQIGDGSNLNPSGLIASQDFEPTNDSYDIAALDDFLVSGQMVVTKVDAAMGFFNSPDPDPNAIQDYRVEIYSSPAAAGASLTGDVASAVVPPGGVTLTDPFVPGGSDLFLVEIPVNLALPGAGTYWVSVMPRIDFGEYGQTVLSILTAGGFPGGLNAYQANPNLGFGFGSVALVEDAGFGQNVDLAYRVEATPLRNGVIPEPLTMTGLLMGLCGAGAYLRRRRGA